jgi:tagatose 6-phosphate kinase
MVLVVGQNSVWQKTYNFDELEIARVNRVQSVFESPAGKGSNVCRVLHSLDCPCELHGYVGGINGRRFEEACRADGFGLALTHIEAETRVCTTLIEADSTMTELVEPAPQITDSERHRFAEGFQERIPEARLLVIAGTAVRGEKDDCYERFVRAAHENGIPCVLDSYKSHGQRALAAEPEVLKINRDELAELSGRSVESHAARRDACRQLLERHGLRWMIITAGDEGAEGFSREHQVTVSPPQVQSVNPIGSGDAVTAGVVSTLATSSADWSSQALLTQAVRYGVALGTANCLNIRPGYVDSADLTWVLDRLSIDAD